MPHQGEKEFEGKTNFYCINFAKREHGGAPESRQKPTELELVDLKVLGAMLVVG